MRSLEMTALVNAHFRRERRAVVPRTWFFVPSISWAGFAARMVGVRRGGGCLGGAVIPIFDGSLPNSPGSTRVSWGPWGRDATLSRGLIPEVNNVVCNSDRRHPGPALHIEFGVSCARFQDHSQKWLSRAASKRFPWDLP